MERVMSSFVMVWLLVLIMHPLLRDVYASNDEADALIAFKKQLSLDPDDISQVLDWGVGDDPCVWTCGCKWACITCTDNVVTKLDLGGLNITGSLVPELGNLKNLQHMHLDNNQLSGSIPADLGNLASLESLNLYNNLLTGSIPKELAYLRNLQYLRLQNNQLKGNVPKALENVIPKIHVVWILEKTI
ncbi:Protein kinase superfamily [Orobanche minor]